MSAMDQDRPTGRTGRRFTKEFRADTVALTLDGDGGMDHVARDLRLGETNLGNWGPPGPHREEREARPHDYGARGLGPVAPGECNAKDRA